MIGRERIAGLIAHQGAMCLLEGVVEWSEMRILCRARSHLAADNPLRRAGRLSAVCGCEYGFQAAALHGALLAGGVAQPAGYLVGLRVSAIGCRYLDDPAIGELGVEATLEFIDESGLIYGFRLVSEAGERLLQGRGTIKLPSIARAGAA